MVSVTQVLDWIIEPELLAWYKRVGFKKAEEISTAAKQVGSTVDYLIQADIKGTVLEASSVPYAVEVTNCLHAWQRFKEEHPAFLKSITDMQREVTDGEVVGHPDLEILEQGRCGIVDIKTSKAIQPKHWLQVAKYLDLAHPQALSATPFGYLIGILRLDKLTGLYEYREIRDPSVILEEVKVFEAYLLAYQHGQRIREVMRQQLEQEVLG